MALTLGPPPGMVKNQQKTQHVPTKPVESNKSSKMSDILSSRLVDVGKSGEEWVNSSENEKVYCITGKTSGVNLNTYSCV